MLTTLLCIAMIAVTIIAVLLRNILGVSIPWSEEISRYLMIGYTFFGASVAIKTGEHIRIDIISTKAPESVMKALHLIENLLSLPATAFLIYGAFLMYRTNKDVPVGFTEKYLSIGDIYLMLFVSLLIAFGCFLAEVIRELRRRKASSPGGTR